MKIGLFFGSFNPVHIGHLVIAQAAVNETDLDRVWMVVSPQNPFKKKSSLLGEYDRYRMVELALDDNPDIDASNVEFYLDKPSYTIDTLNHLNRKYQSYEFALIMGEDNLEYLHKWKDAEKVLQYPIYCYPRMGQEENQFDRFPDIIRFEMPYLDISATRIRKMVKEGKSVRYLVPGKAYDYLENKFLYK
jgi:nicotinate-nucleotide adenylyltransferase